VRFYLFSGTENGIYLRGNRKGEEIEDTAMREVEEETGVNQLRVTKNYKKRITFLSVTEVRLKSPIGLKWSLVLRVCPKVS
jgi:8-oxo-dGTP pyrophosphatase MutT (NUDIX family)